MWHVVPNSGLHCLFKNTIGKCGVNVPNLRERGHIVFGADPVWRWRDTFLSAEYLANQWYIVTKLMWIYDWNVTKD